MEDAIFRLAASFLKAALISICLAVAVSPVGLLLYLVVFTWPVSGLAVATFVALWAFLYWKGGLR